MTVIHVPTNSPICEFCTARTELSEQIDWYGSSIWLCSAPACTEALCRESDLCDIDYAFDAQEVPR